MRGAVPQLLQYAFMAWFSVKKKSTGTTLPLPMKPIVPKRHIFCFAWKGLIERRDSFTSLWGVFGLKGTATS
jgi:hypothetical protein